MEIHYRRMLPHIHPLYGELFITMRLDGSLPKKVLEQIRLEQEEFMQNRPPSETIALKHRRYNRAFFKKWGHYLNIKDSGPHWLKHNSVANTFKRVLMASDGKDYQVLAYTIMSNHVHIVLKWTNPERPLSVILQELKGETAFLANKLLDRTGPFWQSEYFDHKIRKGYLIKTIAYVVENPVASGYVDDWRKWPHTWVTNYYNNILIKQFK